MEKYEITRMIDSSNFGTIYLGIEKSSRKQVAIKKIHKTHVVDEPEHLILKKLQHPHIIQLIDSFETINEYVLILEYASGGDLYHLLIKDGKLTEERVSSMICQIVEALQYVHDNGYIHCDVKPENILICGNKVKLADFGLVKRWTPGDKIKINRGSPCYASPEAVFCCSTEGPNIDVWSLGIVIYVLLTGALPFPDNAYELKLAHELLKESGLYLPSSLSEEAQDLLRKMLNYDADNRITLSDMLKHSWMIKKTTVSDIKYKKSSKCNMF